MPFEYIVGMKRFGALVATALLAFVGCAAPAGDTVEQGAESAFTAKPSKHAIVLAHGFDGSTTNRWAFYKVAEALRADGHVVHAAQVSPYKSVPVRAGELAKHVDQAIAECRAKPGCDASKVHIVAHSMGGLDSRYVISKLGYGDRVASLTTISTPHRGSRIADVLLKIVPDDFEKALDAAASAWARTFTEADLAADSDVAGALRSISESYTQGTFDVEVTDDPRVTYLSWAGVSNVLGIPNSADSAACEGKLHTRFGRDVMHWSLVAGAGFVAHGTELRPNDGMVTVESAKWGKFMGCVPADHLDEVGQPQHDRANLLGGFDHLDFYRRLASSLDDEVAAH
jgi:triacylglycerol lipase